MKILLTEYGGDRYFIFGVGMRAGKIIFKRKKTKIESAAELRSCRNPGLNRGPSDFS